MRWYEWILVLVITASAVSIPSAYFYKQLNKPIYVVDLTKLIDKKFKYDDVEKVYNQQMTPDEFMKEREKYLDKLQIILNSFERPVFVKQAVVGGNIIDITDEVEKYLN